MERQAAKTAKELRKGLFNNIRVQLKEAVIEIGPKPLHARQAIPDRHGQR